MSNPVLRGDSLTVMVDLDRAIDALCAIYKTTRDPDSARRAFDALNQVGALKSIQDMLPTDQRRGRIMSDLKWLPAAQVPESWEGRTAFRKDSLDTASYWSVVPRGFSRDPRHCAGIFFCLVEVTIFAQYIKDAREEQGLSLNQTADLVGCTKSHLWNLERGRSTNPTIKTLAGLSAALDLDLGRLATAAASSNRALYDGEKND